jgi:hypothetical protein
MDESKLIEAIVDIINREAPPGVKGAEIIDRFLASYKTRTCEKILRTLATLMETVDVPTQQKIAAMLEDSRRKELEERDRLSREKERSRAR